MIQQKKINVERILRVNRVGAWRIEIEDGKSPRFYADAVMDELLGIQGEISPEERFTFHRARVHPDDMQLFLEYSDKLSETKSEIVYRYIHPTFGEMFVRCSGIRIANNFSFFLCDKIWIMRRNMPDSFLKLFDRWNFIFKCHRCLFHIVAVNVEQFLCIFYFRCPNFNLHNISFSV